LKGFNPGGQCYGYRNVPVEDLSRRGEYGRPSIIGVRQEINDEEASVIRRMFDLYAEGYSLAKIAKTFNSEAIPPPMSRRGFTPAWSPTGIREMLRNEKYIGRVIWNRSHKVRNPETGLKQDKPRPREEWVIVENPSLRIVSDEQWQRVQEQIRRANEKHGPKRLGGLGRTKQSQEYLFSGLLKCGVCGRHIVIVAGTGRYASYGCPAHRYKGICPNSVKINHLVLEQQLIQRLISEFLRPNSLECAVLHFQERLQKDFRAARDASTQAEAERPKLKAEVRRLEVEARNLANAIAAHGHHQSPTLLSRLSLVENRMDAIRRQLDVPQFQPPVIPIEEIRRFVLVSAQELEASLVGDPVTAKLALRNHMNPLILTPRETTDGPVFDVKGEMDLFSGLSEVMLMAAPQGFEPRYADPESDANSPRCDSQ
jgi:hypothetical protein